MGIDEDGVGDVDAVDVRDAVLVFDRVGVAEVVPVAVAVGVVLAASATFALEKLKRTHRARAILAIRLVVGADSILGLKCGRVVWVDRKSSPLAYRRGQYLCAVISDTSHSIYCD